jgi:rhodanese-related sulfurtransferase
MAEGVVPEPRPITVVELNELMARGGVQLVDVRPPFDYFGGRVPGSLNLPASSVTGRAGQIPLERTLVLICDDGLKSLEAGRDAIKAGFTEVLFLEGGFNAWLEADLPTETISDGVTPTAPGPAANAGPRGKTS